MKLVIGNKNYSSWSLRAWILMRHAGLDFEEVNIALFTERGREMIEKWCPSRRVPVLHDGPLVLWDSLAICEYVADKVPSKALWPSAADQRARARAMSAEMHSGFADLRRSMPMNCRRVVAGFSPSVEARIDINRIVQLFEEALQASDGPWLFGQYSVADAMFAPVASRFRTYEIQVPQRSQAYVNQTLNDEAMQQWYAEASQETTIIESSEVRV